MICVKPPGYSGQATTGTKQRKQERFFSRPCGKEGPGAVENRAGRLGAFHSLSVLISRPLGRLRLLLALLLLQTLHLLHVPLSGGRLKLPWWVPHHLLHGRGSLLRQKQPLLFHSVSYGAGGSDGGRAGGDSGGRDPSPGSLGGWAVEDQHFSGRLVARCCGWWGFTCNWSPHMKTKKQKTEIRRDSGWPAGSPGQWVLGHHPRITCQGPHSHFICVGQFCSMF